MLIYGCDYIGGILQTSARTLDQLGFQREKPGVEREGDARSNPPRSDECQAPQHEHQRRVM